MGGRVPYVPTHTLNMLAQTPASFSPMPVTNTDAPILIIGLGNPILGDDGVGWEVANEIKRRLGLVKGPIKRFEPNMVVDTERNIEIDCLALGGLSLMERLIGYEKIVIIDSITTRMHPVGTVWKLTLDQLPDRSVGHTTAIHDTSLQNAIRVGEQMGADLPPLDRVHVIGVEAEQVYDFSDDLTEPVANAVEEAVELVLALIEQFQAGIPA